MFLTFLGSRFAIVGLTLGFCCISPPTAFQSTPLNGSPPSLLPITQKLAIPATHQGSVARSCKRSASSLFGIPATNRKHTFIIAYRDLNEIEGVWISAGGEAAFSSFYVFFNRFSNNHWQFLNFALFNKKEERVCLVNFWCGVHLTVAGLSS